MLGGLVECWFGCRDVGWVSWMLAELVGCWVS